MAKDSHIRSVLKGISWRIIATTTTVVISYFVTGDVKTALSIGLIEFVGKVFIYYLHERAWLLLPEGSIRNIFKSKKK